MNDRVAQRGVNTYNVRPNVGVPVLNDGSINQISAILGKNKGDVNLTADAVA
jgi:hypothetical protein